MLRHSGGLHAFVILTVSLLAVAMGSIHGTVSDDTGLPLPGVTVTLIDELRGSTRTATTDEKGGYRFVGLAAGSYSLQCELAGFATARFEGMRLDSGADRRIDCGLSLAGVMETVTVMGESPTISVSSSVAAVAQTVLDVWAPWRYNPNFDTESYDEIAENPFRSAREHPLSTFSIDVDSASYSNVRRFLQQYELPPKDAVRIEELLNHFHYQDAPPSDETPFAVHLEAAACPWQKENRLVRIGIKGRELSPPERPKANLVFLVDVSGSMIDANKLPLVKAGLKMLATHLDERDRVAIAVYAGASGLVLPSTPGSDRKRILDALEALEAGGSTNGGEGIRLAYDLAAGSFLPGATNRVILATDGDFNVGVTSEGELVDLIEAEAKRGVFLSVLGFGMGNYKDSTLEKLADKGNGNYAYIDSLREARRVLVDEMSSTLVTIAKDVKIQVEFNPARVGAYRLIGYENRLLNEEDFNDDEKDAGEIGAGHSLTVLYELAPVRSDDTLPAVDPLKYQTPSSPTDESRSSELFTLKLRYKDPEGSESRLLTFVLDNGGVARDASEDLRFAAAVASFGMLLRDSPHKGEGTWEVVEELARGAKGADPEGYRGEFLELVTLASELQRTATSASR